MESRGRAQGSFELTQAKQPRLRSLLSLMLYCGILGITCAICSPFPASAKPQPPAMLKEIYINFNRLEENLSNKNWKSAAEGANNVKQLFLAMVPDIKKYSTPEIISQFVEVMGDFSQAIDATDLARSLKTFSMVQSVFVHVMAIYEYPVPPLVTCLEINIHEAQERFKGTSYDAVVREMQELIVLLSQAESELRKKGIDAKEIGNFKINLINTKMSAEVSDPVQTKDGLETIQRQYRVFRAFY